MKRIERVLVEMNQFLHTFNNKYRRMRHASRGVTTTKGVGISIHRWYPESHYASIRECGTHETYSFVSDNRYEEKIF